MADTEKKELKRKEILAQALMLFSQWGFRKTTIEDVAGKLGMTKGNLYFYVKNKQDLYFQAIHQALTQWQAHVKSQVDRAGSAPDKFRAMARSAVSYIESDGVLQALLVKDPDILTLDRENDRFPEANAAAREIIRDIIDLGLRDRAFAAADPDAAVEYLFSIYMMFLIQTYVYLDQKDFHRIFDAALELNLRGLTHPQPQKKENDR